MEEIQASGIATFKDLYAWQEGHKLVLMIYKTTKAYPKEEIFVLTSQMRRCAISITSNIAEGFGRKSYKEKIQFYHISRGSLIELQNQLLISLDVGYLTKGESEKIEDQITITHKILNGLIKKSREY